MSDPRTRYLDNRSGTADRILEAKEKQRETADRAKKRTKRYCVTSISRLIHLSKSPFVRPHFFFPIVLSCHTLSVVFAALMLTLTNVRARSSRASVSSASGPASESGSESSSDSGSDSVSESSSSGSDSYSSRSRSRERDEKRRRPRGRRISHESSRSRDRSRSPGH